MVIKLIVDMIMFRILSFTNLKSCPSDRWLLNTWSLPQSILNDYTGMEGGTRRMRDNGSSVNVG